MLVRVAVWRRNSELWVRVAQVQVCGWGAEVQRSQSVVRARIQGEAGGYGSADESEARTAEVAEEIASTARAWGRGRFAATRIGVIEAARDEQYEDACAVRLSCS